MSIFSTDSKLLLFCLLCLTWIPRVAGEEVILQHGEKQTTTDDSTCYFPRLFDVTILRSAQDDVKFQLTINDVITKPGNVVMMSSDEITGELKVQTVEATQGTIAYHSVDNTAAFVIHCQANTLTNTHSFRLEGTFFYKDTKYRIRPHSDYAETSPGDVMEKYVMEEVIEFNDPLHHDYIEFLEPPEPAPSEPQDQDGVPHKSRSKRSSGDVYYIDVLPIIDYKLYSSWYAVNKDDVSVTSDAILNYMTNTFTSISLRLATLKITGVSLELRMITPHLSKTAEASPYSESNKEVLPDGTVRIPVKTLLEAFKDWVANSSGSLPPHDHAMLFTGYDVYGGIDLEVGTNLTRGLAYIGSICKQDGFSTSVVQDRMAYQSEPVAVHELGHSLGARHDGENNECSSLDRYIMANGSYPQTDSNKLNPFSFSTCSAAEISTKLKEVVTKSWGTSCLTGASGKTLQKVAFLKARDQCKSLFGALSYVCRGSGFPPISGVCTSMYCSVPRAGVCRELVAATGTCCGKNKYCKGGICTDTSEGCGDVDETCPFEDQPGVITQGKTCSQFHPSFCYQAGFYSRCCHTCQGHILKTAGPSCYFGDKVQNCVLGDCGTTFLDTTIKYEFLCCKTCTHTCFDDTQFVFQGKNYSCPEFIGEFGKSYCYFSSVHSKTCCKTCEALIDSEKDKNCYYGDWLHRMNCTVLPSLNRQCSDKEKSYCCETCPTLKVTTQAPTPAPDNLTTQAPVTVKVMTEITCDGIFCGSTRLSPLSAAVLLVVVILCQCVSRVRDAI